VPELAPDDRKCKRRPAAPVVLSAKGFYSVLAEPYKTIYHRHPHPGVNAIFTDYFRHGKALCSFLSSNRPAVFLFGGYGCHAPHCLKKNAFPAAWH
jgi:hypothetical protein